MTATSATERLYNRHR